MARALRRERIACGELRGAMRPRAQHRSAAVGAREPARSGHRHRERSRRCPLRRHHRGRRRLLRIHARRRSARAAGRPHRLTCGNRPAGAVVGEADPATGGDQRAPDPARMRHFAAHPRVLRGTRRGKVPDLPRRHLGPDAGRAAVVRRQARDARRVRPTRRPGRGVPGHRARGDHADRPRAYQVPRRPAQARQPVGRRRALRRRVLPVPRGHVLGHRAVRRLQVRRHDRRERGRRDHAGRDRRSASGRGRNGRRRDAQLRDRRAAVLPARDPVLFRGRGVHRAATAADADRLVRTLLLGAVLLILACEGAATLPAPSQSSPARTSAAATATVDVSDMMGGFPAATFFVVTPEGVKAIALLNHATKYTISTSGAVQVASGNGQIYIADEIGGGTRLRWIDQSSGKVLATWTEPGRRLFLTGIGHGSLAVEPSTGRLLALYTADGGRRVVEAYEPYNLHPLGARFESLCGDRLLAGAGRVVVACFTPGELVISDNATKPFVVQAGLGTLVAVAISSDGTSLVGRDDGTLGWILA